MLKGMGLRPVRLATCSSLTRTPYAVVCDAESEVRKKGRYDLKGVGKWTQYASHEMLDRELKKRRWTKWAQWFHSGLDRGFRLLSRACPLASYMRFIAIDLLKAILLSTANKALSYLVRLNVWMNWYTIYNLATILLERKRSESGCLSEWLCSTVYKGKETDP